MSLVKQVPAGKQGRRFCGVLALCSAISLICQTARAQEVALDLKDALREAAVIVTARVSGLRSEWIDDDRGKHIYTFVDLQVLTSLKGTTPSQPLTLTVVGGTVGDITEVVTPSYEFADGEQCLLLLTEGGRQILGFQNGKISLSYDQVFYDNKVVPAALFTGVVQKFIQNPEIPQSFKQALQQAIDGASPSLKRAPRPGGVQDATPIIQSVTPPKASAGTSTLATIKGKNFLPAQGAGRVEFFRRAGEAALEAQITCWSDTQIVCVVPSTLQGGASTGPLAVTTTNGMVSAPFTCKITFGFLTVCWSGTSPVVTYLINPNYTDSTGLSAAIQRAARTWNNAGSSFSFNYGGTHTGTTSSSNGRNEILWGTTSGSLATTYWWYRGSNLVEADMVCNTAYRWSTSDTPNYQAYDVETLALHEFGHYLVLSDLYGDLGDNEYDRGKVLFGSRSMGVIQRSLHADDVEGIRWIYSAVGTQLPTPVISPSSGTMPPLLTVTIVCSAPGVTLRYTLDGTEPTTSSAIYSASLTVTGSSNIVLKAKAYKDGWTASSTASAQYTYMTAPTVPSSWAYRSNTGKNGVIAVNTSINPRIGNQALRSGDAIGVFFKRNDSLVCAGYSVWQGQNVAITVWGDDDQTTMKDGFAEGEMMNYKLWDSQAGKVYDATVQYAQGSGTFASNGIYVLSSLVGGVSANQKPVFVAKMRDTTVAPNQTLRFTYTASDPNNDALTFGLVNAPSGATITSAGVFSWTPMQAGVFTITAVVSDGSLADTARATVTVSKVNQKPVFVTKMRDTTIAPSQTLSFLYIASDLNNDPLMFSLVNAPAGAMITSGGMLTWTPTSSQVGSSTITVVVSDGSLADTSRATVTVRSVTVLTTQIAYVYLGDTNWGSSVDSLLASHGLRTTVVPLGNVAATNFGSCDLIIVESRTAFGYSWGDSACVATIVQSAKPVLGMGFGGAGLFQQMGLSINWGIGWVDMDINSTATASTSMYCVNPSASIFQTPIPITIPSNSVIQLYVRSGHIAEYAQPLSSSVTKIGREPDDLAHYSLTSERGHYLWGFTNPPSTMTQTGKDLYYNVVANIVGVKSISPPSSWAYRSNTGKNGVIAVNASINPRIGNQPLYWGDAIGVFFKRNDSLVCAGYSVWQGQNVAITVWGDDDQTTMKDGFAEGELINYKLWDSQAGKAYDATVQYAQGGGTFSSNGVYVLSSLVGGVSVNQKPVFVAKMRDTTVAPNQTLRFTYTASDPNNDALTFSLINAPSGATITAGGVISWTPMQAGVFTITAVVSDGSLADTARATVTVQSLTVKVYGTVCYTNSKATPISGVTVTITRTDVSPNVVSTVATNMNGVYSADSSGLTAGTYTFSFAKVGGHPTTFANAADALKVALYSVDPTAHPLSAIQLAAADVNNDGMVNSADALQILLRYVGSRTTFAKGDWVFLPTFSSAVLTTSDKVNNVTAIAVGDINCDAEPSGSCFSKATGTTYSVVAHAGPTILVRISDIFELAVRAKDAIRLGSMSFSFQYPAEMATFLGVDGPDGTVCAANNGVIGVAWYNAKVPLNLKENNNLMALRFRPTGEFKNFSVTLDPKSQMTDPQGALLTSVNLEMPMAAASFPTDFQLQQNYPNPFNPTTTIRFGIFERGTYQLSVHNVLGQEVAVLLHQELSTGNYSVQFDAQTLGSGTYFYKLASATSILTKKMIVVK